MKRMRIFQRFSWSCRRCWKDACVLRYFPKFSQILKKMRMFKTSLPKLSLMLKKMRLLQHWFQNCRRCWRRSACFNFVSRDYCRCWGRYACFNNFPEILADLEEDWRLSHFRRLSAANCQHLPSEFFTAAWERAWADLAPYIMAASSQRNSAALAPIWTK